MVHTVKSFGDIYSTQIHSATVCSIMIYYRPDSKNSMRTPSLPFEPELLV